MGGILDLPDLAIGSLDVFSIFFNRSLALQTLNTRI